jgi:hypothetical protein
VSDVGTRREFLIRRTDGSWFDILPHEYADTLRPNSVPWQPSPRQEGYGIAVEGCEVTFVYDEPGIRVVFEGGALTEDATRRIVLEVCANITSLSGQAGEVVPVAP